MNWVKKNCSNHWIQWQAQSQIWEYEINVMNMCKVNNKYTKRYWSYSGFFIINQNIPHINQFQPSVVFHLETSDLIYGAIQLTGFHMKWNNGLTLVSLDIYSWMLTDNSSMQLYFQFFQGILTHAFLKVVLK